jgi:hypothetical protein
MLTRVVPDSFFRYFLCAELMRLGWKVFSRLSLAIAVIVGRVLQFADIAPK